MRIHGEVLIHGPQVPQKHLNAGYVGGVVSPGNVTSARFRAYEVHRLCRVAHTRRAALKHCRREGNSVEFVHGSNHRVHVFPNEGKELARKLPLFAAEPNAT